MKSSWFFRMPDEKAKENILVDYYAIRLERLTRLRKIAQEYAKESRDMTKLAQANRLISELTQRISRRCLWIA